MTQEQTDPKKPFRCAVVDLGSNSVRLVVYEGEGRDFRMLFNEKALLKLGRDVALTGSVSEKSIAATLPVLRRYAAIAAAMGAEKTDILATSAVRDAKNGREMCRLLATELPGVHIRILSGEEEAKLSAAGVLYGCLQADGVLADIGGGSLELVELCQGKTGEAVSYPIGILRLEAAEESYAQALKKGKGKKEAAKAYDNAEGLVGRYLNKNPFGPEVQGKTLYLVGGAFRALAKAHMILSDYPLLMIHHYEISTDRAINFITLLKKADPAVMAKLKTLPEKRYETLGLAILVLERILTLLKPEKIIFSANGLREGWLAGFLARGPHENPLLVTAGNLSRIYAREPEFLPALFEWIKPLAEAAKVKDTTLLQAACLMSDIGSRDHPEYRAEQSFRRAFYLTDTGINHPERAFLAVCLAVRYGASEKAPLLLPAKKLLTDEQIRRAVWLGLAFRLAYVLSAATLQLLKATRLSVNGKKLILELDLSGGVFEGKAIKTRLTRLAEALALEPCSRTSASFSAKE